MRRAEVPESVIEDYAKQVTDAGGGDPVVWLWPEHVEPLDIFQSCQTQFRLAPSGHIVGLDYVALESVFNLLKIKRKKRRELFWCVRQIEAGALQAFSERDK